MAKREDPFLRWLSQLTGPLSQRHSWIVIGVLLDRLRHSSPAERLECHRFLHRWWEGRTLLEDERELRRVMDLVRRGPKLGRPPAPNPLAQYHAALLPKAEALCARSPGMSDFRRALEAWDRAGLIPSGRRPLPLPSLFLYRGQPKKLVGAILRRTTGKSARAILRQIKPKVPKPPPTL